MNIKKIETILDDTKQLQDEMKLKLHLGSAEAKQQLEGLDDTYAALKSKVQKIADVAGDSAKELSTAAELGLGGTKEDASVALELAANELKESFTKIKKLF